MTQTNDGIFVSPLSGLIFRAGMEFTNWRDFWQYYAEACLLGWPEDRLKWFSDGGNRSGALDIEHYFAGGVTVVITLGEIPQQTYEDTPKFFDFAACAAGMKRGETWLGQDFRENWIPIGTTIFTDAKYIPKDLLDILEARKAAEEAEKQPEPQGMSFEEAWKQGKGVWFPWPENEKNISHESSWRSLREWVLLKGAVERFGNCFHLTQEEAQAHTEWLVKYGEGR